MLVHVQIAPVLAKLCLEFSDISSQPGRLPRGRRQLWWLRRAGPAGAARMLHFPARHLLHFLVTCWLTLNFLGLQGVNVKELCVKAALAGTCFHFYQQVRPVSTKNRIL